MISKAYNAEHLLAIVQELQYDEKEFGDFFELLRVYMCCMCISMF